MSQKGEYESQNWRKKEKYLERKRVCPCMEVKIFGLCWGYGNPITQSTDYDKQSSKDDPGKRLAVNIVGV